MPVTDPTARSAQSCCTYRCEAPRVGVLRHRGEHLLRTRIWRRARACYSALLRQLSAIMWLVASCSRSGGVAADRSVIVRQRAVALRRLAVQRRENRFDGYTRDADQAQQRSPLRRNERMFVLYMRHGEKGFMRAQSSSPRRGLGTGHSADGS
ncbi:hypothetical protein MRX96_042276 [Rhipicephalus microplus]